MKRSVGTREGGIDNVIEQVAHAKITCMKRDYSPSPELQAALRDFKKAQKVFDQAREKLRAACAEDLRLPDVTTRDVEQFVPWSYETLRGIANEYGIPLKRAATVKSIKADPAGEPPSG